MRFEDFSFQYAGSDAQAVRGIDLTVRAGKCLVLCGPSGSGKSTLLRCMKREATPAGRCGGGRVGSIEPEQVAIVFQDPGMQLVGSTVLDSMAFSMENLGIPAPAMRRRMGETVGFLGLEPLLHRSPEQLSGGEKQLVVLCGALMTHPRLLLMDEPVSQLDPVAARRFLDTVRRLNEELGIAVVMVEHRLAHCLEMADRLVLLEEGRVRAAGTPREVLRAMGETPGHRLFVPEIPRLSMALTGGRALWLSPKEWDAARVPLPAGGASPAQAPAAGEVLLSLSRVYFSYGKGEPYPLRGLSLDIRAGERLCVVGGNGSGKSTLLKLACGLVGPRRGWRRGTVRRLRYVPQDIRSYFRFDTVREEVAAENPADDLNGPLWRALGLGGYLDRHPLDLSDGEAAKLAIYCALASGPELLVLDEPTKGLDPPVKRELLRLLRGRGIAVLCATHDFDFAAALADRCAMLFDGAIAYQAPPGEFFSGNRYYTTGVGALYGGRPGTPVTAEEVMRRCGADGSR